MDIILENALGAFIICVVCGSAVFTLKLHKAEKKEQLERSKYLDPLTYNHRLTYLIHKVKKFNEMFGFIINTKPVLLDQKDYVLCHKLMDEENNEYLEACNNQDIVEIADALGDQLYVLLGTLIKHGLDDKIEDIFFEIHNSNMSKLDKDGKPIHDANGKAKKSDQYYPPNIKRVLYDEFM
jgi:predicted HAD superfamily Cof-like phosphohydrolase